jgi:beta-lactamase regulating signal transducer with metallopeptidase domain
LAVAFLLWVALSILRNSPARLRYDVSCVALAFMATLPFVTGWIVYRAAGVTATLEGAGKIPSVSAILPATPLSPSWMASLETWTLPVWSFGVLIFAVRLVWSARHVSRLRREGEPAAEPLVEAVLRLARRMHLASPVRVLMSRLTDTPSVVGWLRPVILLPAASLMNLTTAQLEAVLAHELAHILRHDYLANLLQTVAETLLFYQPGVWWVSSRMRSERELCCDDQVVGVLGDPVGYARALTQLERSRVAPRQLAMAGTAGPLMYRIQRLTGVAGQRPASKLPAALAAGLAAICFLTNVHWLKAQPQGAPESVVNHEAIWVDTVKYGDLPVVVRALGTVTTPATAELDVPSPGPSRGLQVGQNATLQLHGGITVAGKVVTIDSQKGNGTLPVTIQLQTPVGEFVGQEVDGVILFRTLNDVIYGGLPVSLAASSDGKSFKDESEGTLFKLESGGKSAVRVKVRFGAMSFPNVQILEGLQPGDRVILSDMTKYDGHDRIRID